MARSDTFGQRLYIALAGRAGHGKTSLARDLLRHLKAQGLKAEITSFATIPKAMLAEMGLTSAQLYGDQKEVPSLEIGGRTARYAMQSLATEWGRNMLYEDIWVDAWERSVSHRDLQVVIVDDMRHVPELERLHELGAEIFEVYRPALMPTTTWGWVKHWIKQMHAHSSERLNFANYGIKRIVIEEGNPHIALQKLLALIKRLQ